MSEVVTGQEKVNFHCNIQKEQCQQMFIQLYSFQMPARLFSKSFKRVFSSMWTENFQIYKLVLENEEEPEIKLPTFMVRKKAREFQ